jgi:hypothetical protein
MELLIDEWYYCLQFFIPPTMLAIKKSLKVSNVIMLEFSPLPKHSFQATWLQVAIGIHSRG